jgi:hypothetical protein
MYGPMSVVFVILLRAPMFVGKLTRELNNLPLWAKENLVEEARWVA